MRKSILIFSGFAIGVLMVHLFGDPHIEYKKETERLAIGPYKKKLVGIVNFIDLENSYMIIEGRDRSIAEKYKIRIVFEKNPNTKKIVTQKGSNETIFLVSPEEILPGKIVILIPIVENDGYIKVDSITIDESSKIPTVPHT